MRTFIYYSSVLLNTANGKWKTDKVEFRFDVFALRIRVSLCVCVRLFVFAIERCSISNILVHFNIILYQHVYPLCDDICASQKYPSLSLAEDFGQIRVFQTHKMKRIPRERSLLATHRVFSTMRRAAATCARYHCSTSKSIHISRVPRARIRCRPQTPHERACASNSNLTCFRVRKHIAVRTYGLRHMYGGVSDVLCACVRVCDMPQTYYGGKAHNKLELARPRHPNRDAPV